MLALERQGVFLKAGKNFGWCASSAPVIRVGESPTLVKPSEQPVHSLGTETVRLGLSVGSGVREPQHESVKLLSLVKLEMEVNGDHLLQ